MSAIRLSSTLPTENTHRGLNHAVCIDIGNTNVFLAIYDGSELIAEFSMASNMQQTAGEIVIKLMDILIL